MRLDRRLNLVIPLDLGEGRTLHVHSTPIGREVFEANYLVLAKAFSRMHGEGLNAITGPRVAHLLIVDAARDLYGEDGPTRVKASLIDEVVRLTNVASPIAGKGWEQLPFQEVIDKKLIDDEDASEVLNSICFFTLASSMYPKRDLEAILGVALRLWGGRSVRSSFTELIGSLKTSSADESIGATAPAAPSVPH